MKLTPKVLYAAMAIGGVTGIAAAFTQLIDTIKLAENKDVILACNFNEVFSCSTVLTAWQSNLFGFPNSILCLTLFTIFTTSAVAGLAGSKLSKGFRLGVQALTIFTLLFAFWVLFQATYAIGALCILCIFCFIGLLVINWSWLRLNVADLPLGDTVVTRLKNGIAKSYDTLFWALLGLAMGLLMYLNFM